MVEKVKPIRHGQEYQRQVPTDQETRVKNRMEEVWQLYVGGKVTIEAIEHAPDGEITKYRFISKEDGSVLFYEDAPLFDAYRKTRESQGVQLQEQTPKNEIVQTELADPLSGKLPGEETGKGN